MSIAKTPDPAKLVIGIYTREKEEIEPLINILIDRYGELDIMSPWLPFNFTSYYEKEMGTPLFRRIFSFQRMIEQEDLAGIKTYTNTLEQKRLSGGSRRVNIDPGYMLLSRFVLATGKDFSHRIYIGQGIYADLTLMFQKGAFLSLPWTYPDYAEENMQLFLMKVRDKYAFDLKQMRARKKQRKVDGNSI